MEASGAQRHPGTFPREREVRVAGDMQLCRELDQIKEKGLLRC